MVERFNGRIADVLKTYRFSSSRGPGAGAGALRGAVQPPVAPVSAQEQNADADYEGLAPISPASVSRTAI